MDAATSFELGYFVYDELFPKFILFFTLAVRKYEYDNWEDVHEGAGDEAVKEGAEDGQGNHQTTETWENPAGQQ